MSVEEEKKQGDLDRKRKKRITISNLKLEDINLGNDTKQGEKLGDFDK